jgi:hypothetical protein
MSNENQNNSDILHLESLIKQYDIILIQYTQVQTDYMNFLKVNVITSQTQTNSSNPQLVSIKGSTFWGTSGISSSNVSSVGQCRALCSSTSGCSGATYNSNSGTQNNCFLRSGDGDVIAGTTSQYAIVPKSKEYLLTLQNLNAQLMQINNEINSYIQKNSTLFSTQNNDSLDRYKVLQQNFEQLDKERIKIATELSQFQSLNEIQLQSQLTVTKNYSTYILLLFLVILCIFFVSRIVISSDNDKKEANMNVFALIFVIFIITFLVFMLVAFVQKRQLNFF